MRAIADVIVHKEAGKTATRARSTLLTHAAAAEASTIQPSHRRQLKKESPHVKLADDEDKERYHVYALLGSQ